jgi:hypothetical protein
VGGDALARALGVPVLGRFSNPDQPDADENDLQVAYHLGLAASVAGVSVVRIVGAGHSVDLEHMASRLDSAARDLLANGGPSSSRSMREVVDVVGSYAEGLPWAATEGRNGSRDAVEGGTDISASEISYTEFIRSVDAHRSPPGLVVVAPEVLARSELSKIEHLVAITRWPLLGVVTLSLRRSWRRAATKTEEWPPPTQWEEEQPEGAVAAARS